MNTLRAALCLLSLLGPHRPEHVIGRTVIAYNVYRTDREEFCFEEWTRIGKTWAYDVVIQTLQVPMEYCE